MPLESGGAENSVECMRVRGSSLGLPEEFLLWSVPDIEAWRSEISLSRGASPLGRPDDFEEMARSWAADVELQPAARDEIPKARSKRNPQIAAKLAAGFEKAGAQCWIPFVLCWAQHSGFKDSDSLVLGPLLDAARVDASNVGLLATNLHYGSFNARVARVAGEVRRRGGMDDAAARVVHARWEDLWCAPSVVGVLASEPFGADYQSSRAFFEAEALRAKIYPGASHKPRFSRL